MAPRLISSGKLVMEDIETRALETFADPPRLWKRYVDDTFVIMKRSKLLILDTSEHNRKFHPIHNGIRKRMPSVYGPID